VGEVLFPRWGIFNKTQEKEEGPIATFTKREFCEEYIKLMREQCFFETSSFEEADKKWAREKFLIERTVTFSYQRTLREHHSQLSEWN
jgi:hypothetical protein